jgi:RimJ/RimL family protein N-acetyltransferase
LGVDALVGVNVIEAVSAGPTSVSLRDVTEDDLQIFFEQQLDPEASRMAAFPARDKDAHMAHWHKTLTDETVVTKAILFDGRVAGNIVSWLQDGERAVGYWIGRSYWGKGIATTALSQLLGQIKTRPLYAYVANHNIGSIRVLEKCGFTVARGNEESDVDEVVLILGSQQAPPLV